MKKAFAHLPHILCACIVAITAICDAVAAESGTFTATHDRYVWVTSAQDSLRGRHDELGLDPRSKDSLSTRFTRYGLVIGRDSIAVSRLSVQFDEIDQDHASVGFSAHDSTMGSSELVWSTDSTLEQVAGDFWPGDVVAVNSNVTINGEVAGSVLVIGGDLVLREAATIRGGAVVVGGILRQRGDGKIYGSVFAPAGHRRPRLSITRAWEFEDEGVQWGPSFSYDRVDGARVGGNFAYQRSIYSPKLSIFAGYAIGSETWQYRFSLEQRIMKSTDLRVHGCVFRLTETDDDMWVGRHANSIYAIMAGSDYRDYYGTDGGELGATYKYRERGVASLRYRNTDYRWMDAEQNLWHLFRPNHRFRENFSTVPTDILEPWVDRFEQRTSSIHIALGVEPRESEEHVKRFDAIVRASGEVAGGALGGDYDYDRWQVSVKGEWNSDEVHRLSARIWYGKGRRDLPPNKFFYLGGIGSLPGYPQKVLVGSEAILANFEYRFDYWPNQMFDGGILLFFDVGSATFDEDFLVLSRFKSDVGVGLAVGESIRFNIAKGLDSTDRDIRLSFALWQKL